MSDWAGSFGLFLLDLGHPQIDASSHQISHLTHHAGDVLLNVLVGMFVDRYPLIGVFQSSENFDASLRRGKSGVPASEFLPTNFCDVRLGW
jgi:hypothetical protein